MLNIVSFLILCLSIVWSSTINLNQAELIAKNIFLEKNSPTKKGMKIESTITLSEDNLPILYICNYQYLGFVIIAANSKVLPVIGYSFNNHYNINDVPPQLEKLIDFYKDQIIFAINNDIEQTLLIKNLWLNYLSENFVSDTDMRDVYPLITTNWNQGNSWNDYCPEDPNGPGNNAYAGCTAVSMAQVMNFWEHPISGIGQHSYSHSQYGTISADFSSTVYNWENMSNNSPTNSSRELLFHSGVGVEMDYGADGSGAWVGQYYPSAMSALETYFDYNTNANFKLKNNYSDNVWKDLVRSELDEGRPLIYRGYTEESGHAWNIDGYQGDNYFHCNWGWGGSYNGYYTLSNLSPYSEESNFSYSQGAIFNLYPNLIYGCTNQNACNYDQDATVDDGSCWTPEDENFCDCSGNIEDECGICGGDGSYCSNPITISFGEYGVNWFDINIDTPESIAGFQFNIIDNPNLINITSTEGGLANEYGWTVETSESGIILGFTLEGNHIPPTQSILTRVNFSGSDSNTELCISDGVFSDIIGTGLYVTYGECITLSYFLGDLNSDGIYNVLDVVALVNIVLGYDEPNLSGDLNSDGIYNVLDIIALINIILE